MAQFPGVVTDGEFQGNKITFKGDDTILFIKGKDLKDPNDVIASFSVTDISYRVIGQDRHWEILQIDLPENKSCMVRLEKTLNNDPSKTATIYVKMMEVLSKAKKL